MLFVLLSCLHIRYRLSLSEHHRPESHPSGTCSHFFLHLSHFIGSLAFGLICRLAFNIINVTIFFLLSNDVWERSTIFTKDVKA